MNNGPGLASQTATFIFLFLHGSVCLGVHSVWIFIILLLQSVVLLSNWVANWRSGVKIGLNTHKSNVSRIKVVGSLAKVDNFLILILAIIFTSFYFESNWH